MPKLPSLADNAVVLRSCRLFNGLDQGDCEVLARRAYRQSFRAGDRIFRFGDPGDSMMVILLGSVRISRPITPEKELTLGDLAAGDILGEIAVLDGSPRSAEVVAITNCNVLVLERRDLLPFLETHPKVCLTLLSALCAKIRQADERTSDTFSSISTRLAKTLVRRATFEPGGRLSLSQRELADMVGTTRESVNRQLQAWHEEGLIELRQGWIIVLDQPGLVARSNPR